MKIKTLKRLSRLSTSSIMDGLYCSFAAIRPDGSIRVLCGYTVRPDEFDGDMILYMRKNGITENDLSLPSPPVEFQVRYHLQVLGNNPR